MAFRGLVQKEAGHLMPTELAGLDYQL